MSGEIEVRILDDGDRDPMMVYLKRMTEEEARRMAKMKTKAVQIGEGLHVKLVKMAADSSGTGRRLTIREIVEQAVVKAHPELAGADEPVMDVLDEGLQVALFAEILAAAFGGEGGPVMKETERLAGSAGQPVEVGELVRHMAEQAPSVVDLAGLVKSYETLL